MKNNFLKTIIATTLITSSFLFISCGNTDNTVIEEDIIEPIPTPSDLITINNENITLKSAETAKNTNLEAAIKNGINLSENQWKETKYYYNYVDLNGDGTDEVFVELVGPYTSVDTGNIGFIFKQDNNNFSQIKKFDSLFNPIIISNETTNGWKDIIVPKTAFGTETDYAILKFDGNSYSDINNSETIETISDISGVAIISNDMTKDLDIGIGIYFD